ncbi:MAG: winged helix-turn-helix domain-containing protein [Lachnospiraceae bacterium]|nr:winged helix-turn-helix domain-containing protein [Lachnospiraceae bacterium]
MIISFSEAEEEKVREVLSTLKTFEINDSSLQNEKTTIVAKELTIEQLQRCVWMHNEQVKLTFTEFEILYLLAKNPGRVFSKEQIYDMIWNDPCIGDCSTVMNHIQKIRKKIGDDSSNPIYIQTVWGVGYRFNKEISSNL